MATEHIGHIAPKKLYIGIFLALISLTALTTGVAYIDLGPYNTVAALVIAVCKASLVILFFMHLKYSAGMTRLAVAAALAWLCLLIGLTMADVRTRGWTPVPQGWQAPASVSSSPGEPTNEPATENQ
jgi:cytochrome c oxidase subunit IV